MSSSNKLIVFSAPSGSGKTTLIRHLLQSNLPLGFSISATSRAPRGKELDGHDYYFLTPETFQNKINEGAFVEYEEVYSGLYYGTLISEIERLWALGKTVLFDIDVVGGLNVKAKYPDQTLSIFVQPPSIEVLEKRLRNRATDSEDKIQERLAKSSSELAFAKDFDVILVNNELQQAKAEAEELVRNYLES